jgi:L-glyceraldehyde 3-phosphate reductase
MELRNHYEPAPTRYDAMPFRFCGSSGLKLPALSLGFWHNFGDGATYDNCRAMALYAFDHGVTHFDLANNYGPAYGSAEEMFGRIYREALKPWRDELVISTKAGYDMWPGPYGDGGSRKYLMASLDQSLQRMGLDYGDIFYHHRRDTETPLEETMGALADIVHQGKALYVGISNYNPEDTEKACKILFDMGVHLLINQLSYSMLNRGNEPVIKACAKCGVGTIAFSPLSQGILTGKYRNGIPADSRAGRDGRFLNKNNINPADVAKAVKLEEVAKSRGQTLAQMALAWDLRQEDGVTSVIIGASRPSQIEENLGAINNLTFTPEELDQIDAILAK